jgi:hypothetical protein
MKTFAILFVLLICGCGGDFNNAKCLQGVQEHYPYATVFTLPRENYKFIVVDTCGEVRYVEVMKGWEEITTNVKISNCK